MEEKIYKYGEEYYTLEEIYQIYNNSRYESKKEIKDCICQFILSEILKKSGMENESEYLSSLATYRIKHINKKMNKIEKHLYNQNLFLRKLKILGPSLIKKGYKVSELMNGEWILNKLVSLTLGSNYPIKQIDDFTLIEYTLLSKEECIAISENFLRNLRDDELVQYQNPRTYSKKIKG